MTCILLFDGIVIAGGLWLLWGSWMELLYAGLVGLALYGLNRLVFGLFYWYLFGNSVRVSASQYPELHEAVRRACDFLDLSPAPSVFVMQGHGLLELFLVKRFTKRGILVFTSQMVDALLAAGDTRRLMMVIGRQLGHLRAGHFRWWLLKDVLGRFTFSLHAAWWRRCHLTADRVGYLVCGDLDAARRALLTLTVGKQLADATNFEALREQNDELSDSWLARWRLSMSDYPFLVFRVMELMSFRSANLKRVSPPEAREAVALLPRDVGVFNIVINGPAIVGDHGAIGVGRR